MATIAALPVASDASRKLDPSWKPLVRLNPQEIKAALKTLDKKDKALEKKCKERKALEKKRKRTSTAPPSRVETRSMKRLKTIKCPESGSSSSTSAASSTPGMDGFVFVYVVHASACVDRYGGQDQ